MKIFLTILLLVFSEAWACPGCAGSMDNPKEVNTVYWLMGFMAFTYIPGYFIYKTILKYKNFNNTGTLEPK